MWIKFEVIACKKGVDTLRAQGLWMHKSLQVQMLTTFLIAVSSFLVYCFVCVCDSCMYFQFIHYCLEVTVCRIL